MTGPPNRPSGGTVLHNEYETVLIIRPDLDDAQTYEIVERMEGFIKEAHVPLPSQSQN